MYGITCLHACRMTSMVWSTPWSGMTLSNLQLEFLSFVFTILQFILWGVLWGSMVPGGQALCSETKSRAEYALTFCW